MKEQPKPPKDLFQDVIRKINAKQGYINVNGVEELASALEKIHQDILSNILTGIYINEKASIGTMAQVKEIAKQNNIAL